jgi:hypothetical protein
MDFFFNYTVSQGGLIFLKEYRSTFTAPPCIETSNDLSNVSVELQEFVCEVSGLEVSESDFRL